MRTAIGRGTWSGRALGLMGLGSVLGTVGCYHGVSGGSDDAAEGAASNGSGDAGSGDGSEGGADDGVGEGASPFECDPEATPPELPLRRLSQTQYENTLRDLVAWAVPSEADAVFATAMGGLGSVPDDAIENIPGEVHGGYRRLDQSLHQAHVDASFAIATTLAGALTESLARRSSVVGSCADDDDAGNDAACIDDFIRRFGERALRRPVTDEELAFYRDVFDGEGSSVGMDPDGFADVITVMLTSPQFLYLVEHGDAAVEGKDGRYWLSSWEQASRLSYHFWQSMPDDALVEAARSGALLDDDTYAAQVDRLLADPRAAETFGHYYREWLWLDGLPAMDALVGTPAFDTLRGDFEPGADTTTNMIAEVVGMASWYTFVGAGSFEELFTSDRSFARTPDVASLYGMPVWDGGEPPTFDDDARAGLLTRAALVATGGLSTRPIMKGVFIRKGLLCDPVPPPPNNAAANPPEVSEEMTTREVVEELTEMEGSACAGCHANLINPLGFATENFDPLGRVRAEQVLFDDDGQVVGSKPVDTHSVPSISGGDEPSGGAADLSRLMLESGKPQACFARNLVRFTWARPEDALRDGCVLDDAATRLATGESLAEVLHAMAMQPQFRQRSFE